MGGSNSWRQAITGEDWMREVEKRILHEERRPNIRTSSDLLGPGIAPFSVLISDWNAPETAFNGYFHTDPGALNTPDSTKYWMGTSQATPEGYGLQRVTEYRGGVTDTLWPRLTYIRKFFTGTATQRQFSAWRLEDGTPPGIITDYGGSSVYPASFSTASDTNAFAAAAGWTLNSQDTRFVAEGLVSVYVEMTKTGASVVRNPSGDCANTVVAVMSADYTIIPFQTPLVSGQEGRGSHFNIYNSTRQVAITAMSGTTDFIAGEAGSFGGLIAVRAAVPPAPAVAAPHGWLYCNGAQYVRASYPDLFAAIGVRYNTGGESTANFRVPNAPGKVIKA